MIRIDLLFDFCDLHASRAGSELREIRYYDRDGWPIPDCEGKPGFLAWAEMHGKAEFRIVAHDETPDGGVLSTVWLGLDHGFLGPPMIFETMRFAGHTEPVDLMGIEREFHPEMEFPDPRDGEMTTQLRYTSLEEASAVHHAILRLLRLRGGH